MLNTFREIYLVDFEFRASPGERQEPVCLVAKEFRTGKMIKLWKEEMRRLDQPPYSLGSDTLFVAYYASAEFGCHLSLNWPLPENVLDLFVEFRNLTNGKPLLCGNGLVGALAYFGLDSMSATEKGYMRELILAGGPWSKKEQESILDYCESDIVALEKLLPKMLPRIDLPRALLRSSYMKAAARIEFNGIPIDGLSKKKIRDNWKLIQARLIEEVNKDFDVYEGRTFKADRFEEYLIRLNIPWPVLASGKLNLQNDTFKDMGRSYPSILPLRELRVSLSQMRLADLAVGSDGRNRCMLSAFSSKTGRNQPSNSKFIFGPSKWLRGLIKPAPGFGLAYFDWCQQEFGIAAALSNDHKMIEAYLSGDPYLGFAKQAGAVPDDATRESHEAEREQFKACILAVQYGMGADSLAVKINRTLAHARELLRLHRETYKGFWAWSDSALDYAYLNGKLYTVFGWTIQLSTNPNPRSIRNFSMQANGAEMLRLVCVFATEKGIKICAPVHDAVLIESPLDILEDEVKRTKQCMEEASKVILDGFALRSDVKIIKYPNRYLDEKGQKMWDMVWSILKENG